MADTFTQWLADNAHFGHAKLARAAGLSTSHMTDLCSENNISVKAARRAMKLRVNAVPAGEPSPPPPRETEMPGDMPDATPDQRDDTARILELRRQIKDLQAANATLLTERGRNREMLDEVLTAIEAEPHVPYLFDSPPAVHVKRPRVVACPAVADWHCGEVVSKEQTGGWGEFSFAILTRRIEQYTCDALRYIATMRASYDISEARVLCYADSTSGNIHQELQVTNEFPAPVQAVKSAKLHGEMIERIADNVDRVTVEMITASNHGRLSMKPQHKNAGLDNWDYIVAEMVKQRLSGRDGVAVNIQTATRSLIEINGYNFIMEHGDQYKSWNSIPFYGIQRGARSEAWRRFGIEGMEFDYMTMGHWHTAFSIEGGRILGIPSPKGNCEFSVDRGYVSTPAQTVFLVGSHGVFARTDFELE